MGEDPENLELSSEELKQDERSHAELPAQSKNSSGFPMVVLQESTEPFAAANGPVLRDAFV